MENELFLWDSWDQSDMMEFFFYNVYLTRDIGRLKAGDKFESALISYASGQLAFWTKMNDKEPVAKFHIGLRIKQESTNV